MRSILRAVRRAVPYAVQRAILPCLFAAGLAGCASSPGGNAGLGEGPRSIVLTHPSGESVAVTYWRGDGYDADALREISVLFRDRRNGETIPVDPALIDTLVALRQRTGAPPEAPIRVTSGYRSTATNAALARTNANVAENSYHMRGQAVDFSIPGVPPARLAEEAAAMQRGGYALYPHTGHVHVDTGPFRTWTPKSGGEPRGLPAVQEARARARKVEPVQVAEAPRPVPVPVKAPPAQIARAMVKPAIAKAPLPPDLSKVRTVLAQLKEQPVPGAKERKRN
ncbi:YcbK family protein [Azospirillum doebereinerae]